MTLETMKFIVRNQEKELEIKEALIKEWQARANKKKLTAKKATVLRAEKMLVELEHKGFVK